MKNRPMIPAKTLFVLAAFGIAACGDDSTGPGAGNGNGVSDLAGAYALVTVADGVAGVAKPLPATYAGLSGTLTFPSGTLTLAANGGYTITGPYTAGSVNLKLDSDGTFTRSGNILTFNRAANASAGTVAGTFTGSVAGVTVSISQPVIGRGDLFAFAFRK